MSRVAAGTEWLRGVDFYTSDEFAYVFGRVRANFHRAHGRYPDFANPQGFNDWVVRSCFHRRMKIPESGNKLLTSSFIPHDMRDRVRCPEILWTGRVVHWPELHHLVPGNTYYLKASHGSKMHLRFRWPLDDAERHRLAELTPRWLGLTYGLEDGEWWYNVFPPALLIETDVAGNGFSVNCFCFRGEVALIVLHSKETGETITLGEHLELIGQQHGSSDWRGLFGPAVLGEIRELAAGLSRDTEFARFDFLLGASGEIFLGEVTFTPGGGTSRRPAGVDERLGRLWARSADA